MAELNNFEQTSNFFGKFFKGQQRSEKSQKKANVFDKKVAGLLNDILIDVKQELSDISIVNDKGFNKIQSFADYEQVLKDMEPLLKRVVDPNIEVTNEEGEILKDFLNKQDSLLEDMNKRLKQDKDLQEQLLAVQKKAGIEIRKTSFLNKEMNEFAKENGLSVGKLLDTVSSRMGVISTSLGEEATQALGSALLGPLFNIGKSVVDIGALKDLFIKSTETQDDQLKADNIGNLLEKKNLGIQMRQLKANENIQESLDDQTKTLNGQFEDLEDTIGGIGGEGGGGLLGLGAGGILAILGKKLGILGKVVPLLTKAAGPLSALTIAVTGGFAAFQKFRDKDVKGGVTEIGGVVGGVAGALGGAKLGALGGAAIGSVVPVIGTAIGGLVGSILGAVVGGFGGKALGKLVIEKLFDPVVELGEIIGNAIFDFGVWMKNTITNTFAWVQDTFVMVFDKAAKTIQDFGTWIGDTIGNIFTWIQDKIDMVFNAVTTLFSKLDISGRIKSFFGFDDKVSTAKEVVRRIKTPTVKAAELATTLKEGSLQKRLKEQESFKTIIKEVSKEKQVITPARTVGRGTVVTPTLKSIPMMSDNFGLILINSGVI